MTNLARKRIKLHCFLWRRCTGECIIISLLFRKEDLSWSVVLDRFGILNGIVDMQCQKCISAIGKPEYPHKDRVAIHHTIVQKHHCNLCCLPTLTENMLTAIYKAYVLLKHSVKYMPPPWSSVWFAHPESTHDQQAVDSPSLCEGVVFDWLVLIPTTYLSSKAWQSLTSGAPHPVGLLCLQFKLHTSNSSQWYTMPLHHPFQSQYHPVDLQAHMKTANSCDITSYGVYAIPAWLRLEAWIQFSLYLQFASPYCF